MEQVIQEGKAKPARKVDPTTVQGRRELTFRSFDEVLADAEQLVGSPHTRTLGNWPLSQLLTHLATAINLSLDGISARFPFYVRIFGLFLKRRVLKKGLSPGIKLPPEREARAFPIAGSPREALETLRTAVGRLRTERMTARHPIFGKITHEEWTQFHLRHAELHLSFAVPG
jgi:hypothetical protein